MARFAIFLFISCLSLFASSISIERLSYVSAEPGEVTGGFVVTDHSGQLMPYRCADVIGGESCAAWTSQSSRWEIDYNTDSVEQISVSVVG